jgi:ABC-type branched-subunit amino acid transport system substrate-binding protein
VTPLGSRANRSFRRNAAVGVSLVLIASACGRDGSSNSSTTQTPATAAPATTATTAAGAAPSTTMTATSPASTTEVPAPPTTTAGPSCDGVTLEATEVGVTADTITIEVMADVGSPLAPGLFQANIDAVEAFADRVNARGGIACRQLEVRTWDTKLTPEEGLNGQIDACTNAFALVGGNSLFNPSVTAMETCTDRTGAPVGLPDIAALANDVNELCSPLTYSIQVVAEQCPVPTGQVRPIQAFVGPQRWFLQQIPDLHGVFAVPGDLPSTVQSAMPLIAAQEQIGVTFDALVRVSGRDEQTAYTRKVLAAKNNDSNYFYNGSGDVSMVAARREATAQNVDVDVWACALGCYSRKLLDSGGAAVEGTYVWMQFLPFEEHDTNTELAAYLDGVGADAATSFGAQAWQAAVLFETAVNDIVDQQGVNGVTRTNLLAALDSIEGFTANGWMGPKDLKGNSDCFVLLQVQEGQFVRVFPEARGTLDCDPANLVTVNINPAAEATRLG